MPFHPICITICVQFLWSLKFEPVPTKIPTMHNQNKSVHLSNAKNRDQTHHKAEGENTRNKSVSSPKLC